MARRIGTAQNDTLNGTNNADIISRLGGNDLLERIERQLNH